MIFVPTRSVCLHGSGAILPLLILSDFFLVFYSNLLYIIFNTKDVTDTPLGELMAIGFVTHELRLYLDTHPNDSAAFETMKELLNLEQEAHRRYVKRYGPLTPADLADSKRFDWLQDPWPWLYRN